MRISTSLFHSQGINGIQKHQEEVLKTQLQLSTGKRVNAPSDDPVAMNQIHSLNRTMNTIDQYAENGRFAKSQLVLEETAIDNTVDALQRARELAIQMANDTYSAENRQTTVAEVEQIIEQVKNMMNYTTSEGEKLFAGSSVFVPQAFIDDPLNPGYYTYIGGANAATDPNYDPLANYGSRFVQVGFDDDNRVEANDQGDPSRVRITDNGAEVFKVPGNSLAAGIDDNILNVLVDFRNDLAAGNAPADSIATDMASSITQLTLVRAEIGGRQNRIETQFDAGESFKLALEERRMNLEEMDIVKGVTDLTQSQNALQMAQQVFTRVQDMSLFNYLR